MSTPCGCQPCTCGCCQGTQVLTPVEIYNRPGQPALEYRVGTQARFLQSMKARLSSARHPALRALTTREPSDFSIALLDGWAAVADVLSFYQERIAQEGYLRTATERRSVLELARLVGYAPRPGVSATVYLAYTLDKDQSVTIPRGSRAQSVPKPGQLPQSFETAEDLEAHAALNAVRPRLSRPQHLSLETLGKSVYARGTATNLKAGDVLLLNFGKDNALARVKDASADVASNRTALSLEMLDPAAKTVIGGPVTLPRLIEKYTDYRADQEVPELATGRKALEVLDTLDTALTRREEVVAKLEDLRTGAPRNSDRLRDYLGSMIADLRALPASSDEIVSSLGDIVGGLRKPASLPPASSRALGRDLGRIYAAASDQLPRLYGVLFPAIRDRVYLGYANARVPADARLEGLEALRVRASLFGHNIPALRLGERGLPVAETRSIATSWQGIGPDQIALDAEYPGILPGQWVAIRRPVVREVVIERRAATPAPRPLTVYRQVTGVETRTQSAYVVAGKVSVLTLAGDWLEPQDGESLETLQASELLLRSTAVYAAAETLPLAEEPVTLEVAGDGQAEGGGGRELELDGLYQGLQPGRWAIVYGERTDIPGTTGVYGAELLMVASVEHRFATVKAAGGQDIPLPGDTRHSFVRFARPLEYSYRRENTVIHLNVVKATHGETRDEVLGAGDAAQAFQTFALKQPPLTYTAAPTAAGAESALEVRVNGVDWHQAQSLVGLGETDRAYQVRIDDDGKTSVVFGDGRRGARLPTGLENVRAIYRSGIGKPGNVEARQVSLLMTKPLGVKEVINPLPASGGADREGRDLARKNAPRAVQALDRLVSVRDYADFAQTFAGIGKALAAELSDGRRQVVHVTIAGADDIPVDESSDLYRNLLLALQTLGDPFQPVELALYVRKLLVLKARVRLLPDHNWEAVEPQVRQRLLDTFGFERRELGQSAYPSEVLAAAHSVPGVAYVDLDAMGALGEEELAQGDPLAHLRGAGRVRVEPARHDRQGRRIRPAGLAFLSPEAPDTLLLEVIP